MISIVLTHYNRVELLQRSLHSFTFNKTENYEVIIVDDCSHENEIVKLKNLVNDYKDRIKIKTIFIKNNEKWYDNPCIPFNIGIREASGSIIILQSAECIHLGNIIDFTEKRLTKNNYFSFSCYSLNKEQTLNLPNVVSPQHLLDIINPPNNNPVRNCEESGWYNHPIYRPLGYHWSNAYMKDDLYKLNLFDERFSKGIAYDDDELSYRSKRILNLEIVKSPIVLHQWHGLGNYYKQPNPVENQLKQDYNRNLLDKITRHEKDDSNVVNNLSLSVKYNLYE